MLMFYFFEGTVNILTGENKSRIIIKTYFPELNYAPFILKWIKTKRENSNVTGCMDQYFINTPKTYKRTSIWEVNLSSCNLQNLGTILQP